jgi:hypothetical protein
MNEREFAPNLLRFLMRLCDSNKKMELLTLEYSPSEKMVYKKSIIVKPFRITRKLVSNIFKECHEIFNSFDDPKLVEDDCTYTGWKAGSKVNGDTFLVITLPYKWQDNIRPFSFDAALKYNLEKKYWELTLSKPIDAKHNPS